MAILFRNFPLRRRTLHYISFPFSNPIHTSVQTPEKNTSDATLIASIIDSLNKGLNWKTLTTEFSSANFTNSLVQTILLQLKEPINSRKALNFFHWSAKDLHLQHGIFTYCVIIHILAKARLIRDAKALLESVLGKSNYNGDNLTVTILDSLVESYDLVESVTLVFDLFIQTCAKLRMIDDILDACKLLSEYGFSLKVTSFNVALHVIQKSDKTHLVWGMYEHLIDKGIYPNEVTIRIMVSSLSKEGKLARFVDIVDRMNGKRSVPRLIVNTCMVYQMIEQKRIEDGLVLLKRLVQKNMILDTVSFLLVVYAKVKMGNLDAAIDVHEEMLKRGFEHNDFVCGLFIGAFCEEGRIEEAVQLLKKMRLAVKPWDETFNQLIIGCSKSARLEDSLAFCRQMVEMGILPSISAVNSMLENLCQNEKTRQGDEILTILLDKGFVPDEETYSHLIAGYGKDGDIEGVVKILFEMEYRSIYPNILGFTSVIVTFCKFGRLQEADKYLEMMKAQSLTPNSHVYETLIAGHLQEGNKNRAHHLHCEMSADDQHGKTYVTHKKSTHWSSRNWSIKDVCWRR